MPRQLLVEYTCDRCTRKWYENYNEDSSPPETNRLELRFTRPSLPEPMQELKFDILCSSCCKTLENIIGNLGKLEKKSPKPKAKKNVSGKEAAVMPQLPSPGTSSGGNSGAKNRTKSLSVSG